MHTGRTDAAGQFRWADVYSLLTILFLGVMYAWLAWLARGGATWWHIDILRQGDFTGVLWGDDAYKFFLARGNWAGLDQYGFNFSLPVSLALERIVATLTQGDQLVARFLHAALSTASLILLYASLVIKGASRQLALTTVALLATVPIYLFVSISFYSEFWAAQLAVLSLFLHIIGKRNIAVFLISLLPLIRSEAIVFPIAFSLYGIIYRRWNYLWLSTASGFAYLLFIVFVSPGLIDFFQWRKELWLAQIPAKELYGSITDIANAFSSFLIIPALYGMYLNRRSDLMPYSLAIVLFTLLQLTFILTKSIYAELRFFVIAMPFYFFFWREGISRLAELIKSYIFVPQKVFFTISFLAIANASFFQIYVVNQIFDYYGKNLHFPISLNEPVVPQLFEKFDSKYLDNLESLAERIYATLDANPDIEVVNIAIMQLYHFIDPKRIPSHVTVVFPTLAWTAQKVFFGNAGAGYFSSRPYGGYFILRPPENDQKKILIIGNMGDMNYKYHVEYNGFDSYLFGYQFARSLPSEYF